MSRERVPPRGADRAGQAANPGKARGGGRAGRGAELQQAMGNGAVARALAERAADRAAERAAPGGRPADAAGGPAAPAPSAARIELGAGEPLAPSARAAVEPTLGPLGDVRVHRGGAAARAARALDAVAFASGRDIVFAEGRYAPETVGGRWLLAHEAAHVKQQRGGVPRLQRQPYGRGMDDPLARFGEGEMMADFDLPGATATATAQVPQAVDQPVTVDAPTLLDPNDPRTRRARERQQQTVVLHSEAIFQWPFIAYAIPAAWVSSAPPAHPVRAGTHPPPPPPIPERPAGEPVGANTTFPPESVAYTPDGRALRVAASSPDFVVVWEATNYAVGAGSALLVQTSDGFFLVDAGANRTVADVVSNAVVQRIIGELHGEPIRGVFLTHTHFDHYSLLRRLRASVMIETVAVNPAQRGTAQHARVVEQVLQGQDEYAAEQRRRIEADADARADFERRLRAGDTADRALTPESVQREWETEVTRRVRALPRTRETIAAPSEGGVLDTIGTRPLERGGTGPLEASTLDVAGTRVRAISDPDIATAEHPRGSDIDTFSSSYLIEMPGGRTRIIVLSDLRHADMVALEQTFMAAMAELGVQGATFQLWQLGHHLGPGWGGARVTASTPAADVAAVHTTRASNFRQMLQMLHNARARGPAGARGSDVVSVSVDPSKVDIGSVELLRSLGFHVYPAGAPGDVQIYEVLTAQGERVTGVAGGGRGQMPDAPATLERAHRARDAFTADAELHRAQARELPEGDAERVRLENEAQQLETQRTELEALEQRYREAVVETRHGQTMDTAPVAEAQRAREAREAIERFCEEHGVPPVETTSVHLTDAALLLIRQDPGAAPAADTPEGQRRARAQAAADLRATIQARHQALLASAEPNPAEIGALYSELRQYEAQLDAIIAETPAGSSRTILLAERTRVSELHRSMVVETAAEPTPSRLPTGELVETTVERVRAPSEPSRLARGMVGALEVTGRVMGAVMAVSSIRGEADLIERYQQGNATAGQLVAGTAERVTSGVVGLQMLRGAKVGGTVFAVISVLQVGEAALGEYEDTRDRNIEMTSAAIHGAVGLACMMIGEVLIATMNPIGILAGAAIMFLGPMLLEVLGLHEWLERRFGFYPSDVTGLHQDLRRLLDQYHIIAGGVSLAMRDATGMSEIRAGNPEQVRERARNLVREHRERAHEMEPGILDAFETAYRTARTSYAGLQELDSWRREFLQMQAQAWTGLPDVMPTVGEHEYPNPPAPATDAGVPPVAGPPGDYEAGTPDVDAADAGTGPVALINPAGMPTFTSDQVAGTVLDTSAHPEPDYRTQAERRRDAALARFGAIESTMSLSGMTVADVQRMDQWSQIHTGIANLLDALPTARRDGDWKDARTKQRELRMMIDNARYRLEPGRYGDYRTTPLLAPGSEARREYERLLRDAENRVQETMFMVSYAPFAARIPYGTGGIGQGSFGADYDPVVQAEMEANGLQDRRDLFVPTNPSEQADWGNADRQRHRLIVDDLFTTYTTILAETPRPPARFLENNALYRDFSVLQNDYAQYIRDDDHYDRMLARLEAIENSTDMAIGMAERMARDDIAAGVGSDTVGGVDAISGGRAPLTHAQDDLQHIESVRQQFNVRRAGRQWREGLVFSSEIQQMAGERHVLAVRAYSSALGAGGHPISSAEEAALRTGELGPSGERMLTDIGAIENRLMLVHDLRIPAGGGVIEGILRLDPLPQETRDTVKLVGVVRTGTRTEYLGGLFTTHQPWRVIALNARAEEVLGDASVHDVPTSRLQQAVVSDLPLEFRLPEIH